MLELDHHRKVLKLPLTPLIDVVFILLLFFMLSSTFIRYQQISFETSSSGATSAESVSTRISLIVTPEGTVIFDGQALELDSTVLADYVNDWIREEKTVIVTARSSTSVQTLINALDTLSEAGVSSLSLSESF